MSSIQDVWNVIFRYAFPISFLGSIFYGMLSVLQLEAISVITNKNWLTIFNTFIGLCGLLSFAAWFNSDLTGVTNITQLIGLDANVTRNNVSKSIN